MIGFLRGEVAYLYTDCVLLDVQGVGYRVYIADSTRRQLHLHEQALLFTHMSVREDDITLYGFATEEEYALFQQLISVSGIGPKVALGMLSSITVASLCQAIQNKQTSVLTKLPGIGKKSAERLILELKDKLSFAHTTPADEELFLETEGTVGDDIISEAQAALQALGYAEPEITPVLRKATGCQATVEGMKVALKQLSKF